MHVIQLRQLRQRLLPLDRGQSNLRLESRAMVAPCTSRHVPLPLRGILAAVRQGIHLSACSVLPGHLCIPWITRLIPSRRFSDPLGLSLTTAPLVRYFHWVGGTVGIGQGF